ncbi:MAG TPA: AtpZ/AtpI family protein [Dehalococcoidia bacterium]|nr:AtpZ/AtpI family protein [Dehalococcoidia bacterium]
MSQLPPAVRLLGIGWYFAFCIAGGVIGGVLLDDWLETRPVFTLLGTLLGLALALVGGYLFLIEVLGNSTRGKRSDGA